MRKNSVVLLVIFLFATNVWSGTLGPIQENIWSLVISLAGGPVWERSGETETIFLSPEIVKTYKADKRTRALAQGELFIGGQRSLSETLQGQIGLDLGIMSSAHLSGVIWDDAEAQFNNFTYNYKIQHEHIMLQGKIIKDMGYPVLPWISAGIGAGSNRSYAYQSTPTIFEALPTPPFASKTRTSFAWSLGAGLQKTLSAHCQIGAGFAFTDWGQSRLGWADGQTLHNRLNLNHLYTSGILFNLTYVA
jgi:opacity protein-like surface antigen